LSQKLSKTLKHFIQRGKETSGFVQSAGSGRRHKLKAFIRTNWFHRSDPAKIRLFSFGKAAGCYPVDACIFSKVVVS
jgi:hypothetical protein